MVILIRVPGSFPFIFSFRITTPGRPQYLTPEQEQELYRTIVGQAPRKSILQASEIGDETNNLTVFVQGEVGSV